MERKNSCRKHPGVKVVGVCSVCLTERLNQLLLTYSCDQHSSHNLKIRTHDVAGTKMSRDQLQISEGSSPALFNYSHNARQEKISFPTSVLYIGHTNNGSRGYTKISNGLSSQR
ncbi:hypothetical protein SUGI_0312040 [Cryptomeria japonica]|nr:hypothetical protein SUGI_0312040 [Cryptomeria japonica]